jgi:hypothetical protein
MKGTYIRTTAETAGTASLYLVANLILALAETGALTVEHARRVIERAAGDAEISGDPTALTTAEMIRRLLEMPLIGQEPPRGPA